jgi:hypothetical protein
MDSFVLFFPLSLSGNAIHEALLSFDFGCTLLEPNYMTAHLGDARVYITLSNEQEINDQRSKDDCGFTIPNGTLTMADVEVRKNSNSDVFAIFLAERLILTYGGSVDWNGISHWEQLYEGLQRWRKEHPKVSIHPIQSTDRECDE